MRAPTSAHKIGPLLVSAWALVVIAGAGGCGSSAPLTPSIDDAGSDRFGWRGRFRRG